MAPLLHSLQIATLATWLSVVGFGAVGLVIHSDGPEGETPAPLETRILPEDFTLGDTSSPETGDSSSGPATPAVAGTLPAPPEMPELTEFEPLPEVPSVPAPTAIRETRPTTKPAARTGSGSPTPRSTPRKTASSGSPSAGGRPGMAETARLAGGRMPPPSYPPQARRRGQSGTVVVEFTVDASGRVISAYAKTPSPWPLLNEEAVRTVRRWKFPPGGVMKLQRPIVFQLR